MNPAVEALLNFYNKEANMPKLKLSKKTRLEWVTAMSKKQNKVKMLNGGQLAEAQSIAFDGMLEISPEAKAELAAALIKSV